MVDPSNDVPRWLDKLLHERLINPCSTHQKFVRNEKTRFCLDCCLSFCPYCIHNPEHHLLQIRRYKDNEVVRKIDMDKLINCSCIQPYSVNRAHVVFLKERTHCRPFRNFNNSCFCGRALDQEFGFCSITCKVKLIKRSGGSLARHIRCYDSTSSYTPKPSVSTNDHEVSLESASDGNSSGPSNAKEEKDSSTQKNVSFRVNRRKGVPTRSPFY